MLIRTWRPMLAIAGILLLIGGPLHPKADTTKSFNESTALMLAHPNWPIAHALILASYILLLLALVGMAQRSELPNSVRRILRFAQVGAALAVVEMAFHLAATADRSSLIAGGPTPLLTAHMTLAVVAYPMLGLSVAALALQGARTRSFGGWAIGWLGALGGVAHGMAAPIVVLTRDQRYSPLFMGAAVMALWLCLVAIWPIAKARASMVAA
jgi:hypothetical protein